MAFVVLGIVAFIALVVAIVVLGAKAAQKRRDDLAAFAQRHGFQAFVARDSGWLRAGFELLDMFQDFTPFGTGERPRAFNAVVGGTAEKTFYFFDYEYVTTSTTTDGDGNTSTSTTTHSFGVAAVRVPLAFRQLEIRHEGLFDKIGGALGFKDIQFEMDEFNRRFHVKSPDQKFAYDVVHPGMIEFLMRAPARFWQLGETFLLIHKQGAYPVEEFDGVMQDMESFLGLIPEYVRQDIGFQPNWSTPFE